MTEMIVSPHGQKLMLQSPSCKASPGGVQKDLYLIVREGSLAEVESALALLKKNGGNINSRNTFGLTPLHIAIRRNNVPIVRRLLAAGADPDVRDGESGWSSLHRALHFGHLAVASVLLQSSASITLEDCKSRTPVDLLSGPVLQAVGNEPNTVATEVYSWGSGANYQLGTGNAHLQRLPCKVDLHDSFIKLVSAAKFHSVAVTTRGEVYTWGFGRGGRLGHPDFDIHSGQAAVITPLQVTSGLGSRCVKKIAAAKHHTVLATEGGEVFTWGSNREGQLGYTSVDTQPTPRRVSSLKSKIIAVAAANKHTAVVSESGEVFTWGCNREGQLGYGTSNSASNYTPRVVESLKGKVLAGVAAAKYHTIVLGVDGEVHTWGHRLVTPKRVIVARNLKKSGSTPLKYHRMERLHVVAIAAGMVHSMVLTEDGALFYWVSSDADRRCHQVYSMCGRNVVSISAGKYWSAAVTSTGDVYMCDAKESKDNPPILTQLHGVKRATSVTVGETHLLIVGSLYHPFYAPNVAKNHQKLKLNDGNNQEEFDEDFMFNDNESNNMISTLETVASGVRPVPSLVSLCEKVAAESLVEPRNALQLLEIADSLRADDLKKYCEDIAIRNLDYILTVSSHSFASASLDILADLEKLLDIRSSESWSYRRLPTPTATFPVIINSEEEDTESEVLRTRENHLKKYTLRNEGDTRLDSFLQPKDDRNRGISKQVRALRKKLQQIEMLEVKLCNGHILDEQQTAKLQTKSALESSLAELGVPVEFPQGISASGASCDGRGNKKAEKKQKKKSKKKVAEVETVSDFSRPDIDSKSVKDLFKIQISEGSKNKEEDAMPEGKVATEYTKQSGFLVQKREASEGNMAIQYSKQSIFLVQKDNLDSAKNSQSSQSLSKKKNKNKKGGLSMFLSGALDDTGKEDIAPASPLTPKMEGPAWGGGAKVPKGAASLREILSEQSKIKVDQPSNRSKDQFEDVSLGRSEGKILLSSFLTSKPIHVVSARAQQAPDGEKSTPTWAASGTPPSLSRPSLRDIQKQQGKQKNCLSQSPKTRTAGFSVTSAQSSSPSDSPGINRWFKPEVETPSSIRSIQIEEKAMKDLMRFCSSVKIIRNQS